MANQKLNILRKLFFFFPSFLACTVGADKMLESKPEVTRRHISKLENPMAACSVQSSRKMSNVYRPFANTNV